MEKIPDPQSLPRQLLLAHNVTESHPALFKGEIRKGSNPRESLELDPSAPIQEWRGNNFLQQEDEEAMPDVMSFKVSSDSFEEAGSTSFHGASHPPEPVDTDLMRPVYLPISRNNGDRIKSLPTKGPFWRIFRSGYQTLNQAHRYFRLMGAWLMSPII